MTSLLMGLSCLLSLQADAAEPEGPPPEMIIELREAAIYKQPSLLRGIVRKARYGEKVTVIGERGRFRMVRAKDGKEGWVTAEALVPPGKFKFEASDEAERGRMEAQNFESVRFNPETEQEYRQQKGPAINRAYLDLDELEKRRPGLEARDERLRKFREEGKLGEFAPVNK